MIKLVLLVVVISCCGYVGYGISLYFKKRNSFFNQLNIFIDSISADIKFSQQKLKDIFDKTNDYNDGNLTRVSQNYCEYLNNKDGVLNEKTLFKGVGILKSAEKNFILLFFNSLGKHDVENQADLILSFKNQLQAFCESVKLDNKRFGGMSTKLGFLVGCVIALILV